MSRFDPLAPAAFRWLLAGYVLARLGLGLVPGYLPDLADYTRWSLAAADHLPSAYEATDVDYPPGYLYPLWLVGVAWTAVRPAAATDEMLATPSWMLAIKLPPLAFDLLAGWLLHGLVARRRAWGAGAGGDPRRAGRLAAAVYLLNPAVLWNGAYWGQADSVVAALLLAAVARLAAGHHGQAGALWCAATMTKPLGAPFLPLLAWWSLGRHGWRGLAGFAAGAATAGLLLVSPFLLTGRGPALLERMTGDLDAMPFTSVYAHNLWWILGPWRDANEPWLGPLTPKALGLMAFGAACAALLVRVSRSGGRRGPWPAVPGGAAPLLLSAAAVACTFFFFSTLMHENHLFLAVPLLIGVAGRDRRAAVLALVASVAVFANMALHDLVLPRALPGVLGAESPVLDPWARRPYTWLQLGGSLANTLAIGWLTVAVFVRAAAAPARPQGPAPG